MDGLRTVLFHERADDLTGVFLTAAPFILTLQLLQQYRFKIHILLLLVNSGILKFSKACMKMTFLTSMYESMTDLTERIA
jgi:hypothetical protein